MKPVPAKRPIADFVRPPLSEGRIDRVWARVARNVEARGADRPAKSRARLYAWLAAAAVVAFALSFALTLRPRHGGTIAGLVVETGDTGQPITLPDGSTLAVSPWTRLAVLTASTEDVRLRLERGTLTCDVVPGRPRRFVVEAGGAEVEVKGTRFVVEVTDEGSDPKQAVTVRVEHGVVEVRDESHTAVANLKAGQVWMNRAPLPPPPEAPPPEETHSPADLRPAPAPSTPAPSRRAAPSALPSARELFEQGDAAQLAGRAGEAAASFDQVRRRFPNDPHAGIAAFQCGRLRLRKLGDPHGAAEAFAFALAHDDTGAFREDAAAGLVEALARAGDAAGCRKARSDFLARYGSSPLATSVMTQCSE